MQLDLKAQSSFIESEICAKLNRLFIKPIEVDSKYIPRVYGTSKGASWAIIKKVYIELFKIFINLRQFDPTKVNLDK